MVLLILVVLMVLWIYQFGKFFVIKNLGVKDYSLTIGIGPVIYSKNHIEIRILPVYAKVNGYKTRNAAPIVGGLALVYMLTVISLSCYNIYEGVPTNKVLCATPDTNIKVGDVITEDNGNLVEVKRGNRYFRYILDEPVQIEFVRTKNPFKAVTYSVDEIVYTIVGTLTTDTSENAMLEVVCLETGLMFVVDLFGWFLRWLGIVKVKVKESHSELDRFEEL